MNNFDEPNTTTLHERPGPSNAISGDSSTGEETQQEPVGVSGEHAELCNKEISLTVAMQWVEMLATPCCGRRRCSCKGKSKADKLACSHPCLPLLVNGTVQLNPSPKQLRHMKTARFPKIKGVSLNDLEYLTRSPIKAKYATQTMECLKQGIAATMPAGLSSEEQEQWERAKNAMLRLHKKSKNKVEIYDFDLLEMMSKQRIYKAITEQYFTLVSEAGSQEPVSDCHDNVSMLTATTCNEYGEASLEEEDQVRARSIAVYKQQICACVEKLEKNEGNRETVLRLNFCLKHLFDKIP